MVSPGLASGVSTAAYGYIAAGAIGMGMLAGLAIAVTTSQARVAAAPRVADAFNTSALGLGALPAPYAGASLLSKVEPARKPGAASVQLLKITDQTTHKHRHRGHRLHKLLSWKKADKGHKTQKRMAYVSPNTQAPAADAAPEPTALQLATAAAQAGPFFLGIQGDVTVANYDAATGTIQTYEGETYLLAKNTAEAGSIQWQDYPFNVHYHCDGIGNCMLSHAGISAIAKLAR